MAHTAGALVGVSAFKTPSLQIDVRLSSPGSIFYTEDILQTSWAFQ